MLFRPALRRTSATAVCFPLMLVQDMIRLGGECFEKNSAYLGRGIVLNKFTGARGKSGSNDANAEYVAKVRKIFDDNQVAFPDSGTWQS